ncbi:DUF5951 family protein [Klebsiella oxytoca]
MESYLNGEKNFVKHQFVVSRLTGVSINNLS